MEIQLTKNNFEAEVPASDIPVLIDFYATWCGPCKMLSPVMADIAREYAGKVKVCVVNTDEEPELCNLFQIMSIPAVFLMKGGKIAAQFVGYRPKSDIVRLLEDNA